MSGSYFVPDVSVFEHNDPSQPLTGGGHDWAFTVDAFCKMDDLGPAGGVPTSWGLPANALGCVFLPVINNGTIIPAIDSPLPGDIITPTCDPAKLSAAGLPNPANTYFNQLGCSISHGVATTPQTATSFLFTAGITTGLFRIALTNVANPAVGGSAGKMPGGVGLPNYYSAIPQGQRLTSAIVSKDGRFAIATSNNKLNPVYGCLDPLGDPGDPGLPINPGFAVPPAGNVLCMQVGNNALQVDQTDAFGPDGQPYLGGQPGVNTFGPDPGGAASGAWPQCIWENNGSLSLADAFVHKRQNGCNNAAPNVGFMAANVVQPPALLAHGQYVYAVTGGAVMQIRVTKDPASGSSQYASRTYLANGGNLLVSLFGLGAADDLASLMVYGENSSGFGVNIKLPLCEDL